jgi:hypothetical protein
MKVIVAIIASKDPVYNKFKDIWIKCINYIKTTNLNYDFYFIYSEEIQDERENDIKFTLDIYPNYTNYYYKYIPFETKLMKREVIVLNKILDFYEYIKNKLNLDNNDSYNYNTLEDTTYVLRTNLSSLFDFVKMYNYLLDKPKKNFFAGTINGFYNNIYTTISGMNSILSLDIIIYSINNANNIRDYLKVLNYEDDTMSNYIIQNLNVFLINIKRLDFIEMEKVVLSTHVWPATPKSIIYQKCNIGDQDIFSFRFKTFNRTNDIEVMNMLNDNILKDGFILNNVVDFMSKSCGYLINTESETYGDLFSKKPFKIINLI